MKDMLSAFNRTADYFYENIPGVIAIINSVDSEDKNMVNDLQIFKDIKSFYAHANMSDPTIKNLLMDWSMHW